MGVFEIGMMTGMFIGAAIAIVFWIFINQLMEMMKKRDTEQAEIIKKMLDEELTRRKR